MTDESIAIRIVQDGSGDIKASSKSKSDASLLTIGTKLTGVFNIAQEIVDILKNSLGSILNPIRTILTGIGKLIAQFLRPITDMVIVLLMPILQTIRPFIRMFNELMKPFRDIAYSMMRDASKVGVGTAAGTALMSGAMGVLMTGLGTAIAGIMKELLKMVVINLGTFLKMLISAIGELLKAIFPFAKDGISNATEKINGMIDSGITTINNGMDAAYDELYKQSLKLAKGIQTGVYDIFTVDIETAKNKSKLSFQSAINDFFKVSIPGRSSFDFGSTRVSGGSSTSATTTTTRMTAPELLNKNFDGSTYQSYFNTKKTIYTGTGD